MIPIVLFVFGLAAVNAGCPTICNCTSNSIDCVSKDLDQVPHFESLTNNPVIIDLSGNSISIIDTDDFSFDKSDIVMEVYLNNSGIVVIEQTAFQDLKYLQELYLSNNMLNSLPPDFIATNEDMVLLDLSSNYFTEMPKIISESLEVLTLASSGISKISNDALDDLPNLRFLMLQQNNLKVINPVIFHEISNFLYIEISNNPWECGCKTVKLFDYLNERKFVALNEPVQCFSENRNFIDIYNDNGVVPYFKERCKNVAMTFDDDEEIVTELSQEVKTENVSVLEHHKGKVLRQESDFYITAYFLIALVGCVVLSLMIGAICGSYITFKYLSRSMRQTESQRELMFNEKGVTTYTFT